MFEINKQYTHKVTKAKWTLEKHVADAKHGLGAIGFFTHGLHGGRYFYYNEFEEFEVRAEEGTFIVWGPSGHTNPRVKFKTFDEADKAAKAMTIQHKQMFYAMKAVSKYEPRVTVEAVAAKL